MATPGPPQPRARLVAAVGVALLTLAALEGAWSLSGHGSLFRRVRQVVSGGDHTGDLSTAGWMPLADLERERATVTSQGLYRTHPDPRVGYALRADAELAIHDVPFRTDDLGLRRRPDDGEPEPEDALRVVILGASLPFGMALPDDQVMAHVLEGLLDERRAPDAPPVLCRTVAAPRWNHRNAVSFLLDHWDALRPDIVVYMPVDNDASDTLVVDGSGHRRSWPDPFSRHPGIAISDDLTVQLLSYASARLQSQGLPPLHDVAGALALRSDVGAESVRRHDDAVASLVTLARHAERHSAELLVLRYQISERMDVLFERVQRRGLQPEVLALFADVPAGMTLGFDPHANAETHQAMAALIAARLVERGWVTLAEGQALPPASGLPAEHLSPPFDWEPLTDRARGARKRSRQRLLSVIEPETGTGLAQVYGGLEPEGLVGQGVLVLLGVEGPRLELRLSPLPEREDLYPLEVVVRAGNARLGELTIEAGAPAEASFELPEGLQGKASVDVELRAGHWGVVTSHGRALPASFQLERLACPAQ
jgi:hypothetical protein